MSLSLVAFEIVLISTTSVWERRPATSYRPTTTGIITRTHKNRQTRSQLKISSKVETEITFLLYFVTLQFVFEGRWHDLTLSWEWSRVRTTGFLLFILIDKFLLPRLTATTNNSDWQIRNGSFTCRINLSVAGSDRRERMFSKTSSGISDRSIEQLTVLLLTLVISSICWSQIEECYQFFIDSISL